MRSGCQKHALPNYCSKSYSKSFINKKTTTKCSVALTAGRRKFIKIDKIQVPKVNTNHHMVTFNKAQLFVLLSNNAAHFIFLIYISFAVIFYIMTDNYNKIQCYFSVLYIIL